MSMNQAQRHWKLSTKLTAVYSILILIICGTLAYSLYWQLRMAQRQAIRERLYDIINLATPLVDGDFHSLIRSPEDENSPFYEVIARQLGYIQATSSAIKRVHTLRQQNDGRLVYVVDVDVVQPAHVAQDYPPHSRLSRLDLGSITVPFIEDALYTDSTGTFLSGYAPIYDRFHKMDGVLRIDLDATTVLVSEAQARRIALTSFLATAPLTLLVGWWLARRLTSPLIDLLQGAQRMAQGHLNQKVYTRSHDEVGMLAEAFNEMAVRLQQLVSNLELRVAELKRTQEALRRSEEHYRSLFNGVPAGLYRTTPQGDVLDANLAMMNILGVLDRKAMLATNAVNSYVDSEARRQWRATMERQGVVHDFEAQLRRNDGAIIWVRDSSHAFRNDAGEVLYYEGSLEDITERKQAELEIARLQHLLQNITDSMPSVLITLDLAGQVLTWNPAAQAMTGKSASQVQGRPLWLVCPELTRYRDMVEHVIQENQVAHRHKEPYPTENGVLYRDASVFPLGDNGIEGVVLRIDDVTQRVQLEDIMLQSAKLASIGGLTAGIAHEINNPLTAIIQSAQMLQLAFDIERPLTQERLKTCGIDATSLASYLRERQVLDYVDGIRNAGGRAAKIVADLLSFSRKSPVDVASHDLNTLVEKTLDLAATDYDLKKKFDFRDISIVYELAPDLPAVTCDGQQIQQVILNLVRNAAQAMGREKEKRGRDYKPRLIVRTAYKQDAETPSKTWLRLEVEDNGPGVPHAAQARIFEPFFTTKDVGEGTGLGLWLCWSIVVERHAGHIWVESAAPSTEEPGAASGARFVVELPQVKS